MASNEKSRIMDLIASVAAPHDLVEDAIDKIADAIIAAPQPDTVEAEQSEYAPEIVEQIERTDWTPEEALRWYSEGKHFDVVNGRTRIIDTGSVASNALKHLSLAYLEMKGDAELSELRDRVPAKPDTVEPGEDSGFDYNHPEYCEVIDRIVDATARLMDAVGLDAESELDQDGGSQEHLVCVGIDHVTGILKAKPDTVPDTCPQCSSPEIKIPRGLPAYCEDCGWPDENFADLMKDESDTSKPIGEIDEGEEGVFVELYPDNSFKLGQKVYLHPPAKPDTVAVGRKLAAHMNRAILETEIKSLLDQKKLDGTDTDVGTKCAQPDTVAVDAWAEFEKAWVDLCMPSDLVGGREAKMKAFAAFKAGMHARALLDQEQ